MNDYITKPQMDNGLPDTKIFTFSHFHILSILYLFISNVTNNSLITGHFKRHRQTDTKKCKYMMLRQEMESDQINIGACSHNKDDSKQNDDTR